MIRTARQCFGVLVVCFSLSGTALAEVGSTTLAIVAAENSESQAVADLLTAELSENDAIGLVERDRIRAALSELELNSSGLVATDRQVQLGRIVAADVVLFVETSKNTQPPLLHFAAVETRTGLQLSSIFIPADAVDELAKVGTETIQAILAKSRVSDDSRLYVAVAGVHNEEPGPTLTPISRALATCLIHDLQRTPRVFLLERQRLRKLTAERDLAGIELALESSTVLVDVGLRRHDRGEGYVWTILLSSSSGQILKRVALQSEAADFQAIRRALHQRVFELLGGTSPANDPGDHKSEARRFANASKWLYSNSHYEEAVDAAESAFALDPTTEHSQFLRRAHGELIRLALHSAYNRLPKLEQRRKAYNDKLYQALTHARRSLELDLFWLQQPVEAPSKFAPPSIPVVINGNPFEPHIPRLHPEPLGREPPVGPEPTQMQELRADYDALRWRKYRLLTERAKGDPLKLAHLVMHELRGSDYFAKNSADYVRRVLAIQRNIDQQVAALNSQKNAGAVVGDGRSLSKGDYIRNINADILADMLMWVHENRSSTGRNHPQWSTEELLPLWTALMKHDEPKIAVLGCLELVAVDSYRDAAIRRGLEVLPGVEEYGVAICKHVREHLGRTDELETILEDVIARAETAKAPVELTARTDLILALFAAIGTDRGNWRGRIDKVLSEPLPPRTSLLRYVILLRDSLKQQARSMTPETEVDFELNGAWAEYEVRDLELALPGWAVYPVTGSTRNDIDHAWVFMRGKKAGDTMSVGKMSLADGTIQPIARTSWNWEGRSFKKPLVAASDADALYLMTGQPGIARIDLKTKQVREWGSDDGFVGERIGTIAVHRSKVYMGLRGGLCEFDPSTEQFRLLASSRAVEPRSKLDGGSIYEVTQIVSDVRSDCLWCTVGGGRELAGIWRYDVAAGTFERRVDTSKPARYATSNLSWINDDLFFLSPQGWQVLDTRAGTTSLMTGYAPFALSVPPNVNFLRVGDHIVQGNGQLYAPDGKMHDLGFSIPLGSHGRILIPVDNGFMISAKNNQLFSLPNDRFLVFTRTKAAAKQASTGQVP